MKTILFSIFFLANTCSFALAPWTVAPLYDHLFEVNPRWQFVKTEAIDFSKQISFENDIERISMHLRMVEKVLISTSHSSFTQAQLANRARLIEILALYRESANYPLNHYHTIRRPYFIDNYGTACAVGHLLQKSGQSVFAERISKEMNYAYVMDMPYKEIDEWAELNGFTKDELALIQPGYSPVVSWSAMGEGANGEITALYGDETNQRLIIAGNFTELDGISCKQVGTYANGIFSALGSGVSGEIHAIALFEGQLYLGGLFQDSSNIAFWDGTKWTYERLGKGTVYALTNFENKLIAGGDFTPGSSQTVAFNYIARKENGNWGNWVPVNGPIYTFAMHDGALHIGGNLGTVFSAPYYVARLFDNGVWYPVSNPWERLDNAVRSLASDGTYLYAAGDCFDELGNPTFGFARLGNSGWEQLLDPVAENFSRYSLKKVIFHEGAILLAGNYDTAPIVGIYGSGISKFRPNPVFPILEALAVVDSTVNAVASVNGELYIGGAFQRNFPDTVNFIAKTQSLTSIEHESLISVGFYPNPMTGRASAKLNSSRPISALEVFDTSGRKVPVDYEITGNELIVERGRLLPGIYVAKILTEDQVQGIGKFMVK